MAKAIFSSKIWFLILCIYLPAWPTFGQLVYDSRDEQQVPLGKFAHTKQVAIVGAGSAGASAAYFLRQLAEEEDIPINITIFERRPYIGGRSTTVHAYNDPSTPVELGASIFVDVNHNLVSAVKAFNLSTTTFGAPRGEDIDVLGIWNGNEFVFTQTLSDSTWRRWWNNARVIWRYGLNAIRAVRTMQDTVGRFLKLYDYPYFPFESLSEAAFELNLTDQTSVFGDELLGRDNDFAWDIVQASTRVNYAQNLGQIHGLESMVCLATDGAMSVIGGNWQIFAEMINRSGAFVHLQTEVTDITRDEKSTRIRYKPKQSSIDRTINTDHNTIHSLPSDEAVEKYDSIILAAPFHQLDISFSPKLPSTPPDIPYVNLHVTLFTSPYKLSGGFFDLSSDAEVPTTILTTLPRDGNPQSGAGKAGFFSISTLRRLQNPRNGGTEFLYKIFSPQPVGKACLEALVGRRSSFKSDCFNKNEKDSEGPTSLQNGESENIPITDDDHITWAYHKLWLSYPYLPPRISFDEHRLEENIWWTGAIESFISTMETSSLMGKNVARLIVDEWLSRPHMSRRKGEKTSNRKETCKQQQVMPENIFDWS